MKVSKATDPAPSPALLRGLCHDLKNHLTAIQGNAELASHDSKSAEARTHCLSAIRKATREAHQLCSLLGTLASGGSNGEEHHPWALGPILHECLGQLVDQDIDSEVPEEALVVVSSRPGLALALRECLKLALQLNNRKAGPVTLRLERVKNRAELCLTLNSRAEPPVTAETLLDPAWVQAQVGASHALGLMVVLRVLHSHEGKVQTVLDDSTGTATLTLSLPLSKEPPRDPPSGAATAAGGSTAPGRKRRVLLVDDEEFMLHLGVDILQTLNCRVSVASDGCEALELIRKKPDYFDIVFSDSRMPSMTGEELALAIHKIRPELPFILVTAFTIGEAQETLAARGINGVIGKPFLIEDLKKALNESSPLPNHARDPK